jgi:hypothetical protein
MPIDWDGERRRLMSEYRTPIPMENPRISIPIQTSLIEYRQLKATTHGVGVFYEVLTKAIFGGSRHEREHVINNNGLGGLVQETVNAVPDLTDHGVGVHWESKGLSLIAGDLKLYDGQTTRYMMLQASMGKIPDPEIVYCVYCYAVGNRQRSIQKMSEGKLEKIISLLAENTTMSFFLPLSLILHLHKKGTSRSVHRRTFETGEQKEQPMTRIRPKQLLGLMQEPLQEIERLHLRAGDYEIYRARLPEKVSVNSHQLSAFPVLVVKDKSHGGWLKRFNRIYSKEAEKGVSEVEDEAIEHGLFDPRTQKRTDIIEQETEKAKEKEKEVIEGRDVGEDEGVPF